MSLRQPSLWSDRSWRSRRSRARVQRSMGNDIDISPDFRPAIYFAKPIWNASNFRLLHFLGHGVREHVARPFSPEHIHWSIKQVQWGPSTTDPGLHITHKHYLWNAPPEGVAPPINPSWIVICSYLAIEHQPFINEGYKHPFSAGIS